RVPDAATAVGSVSGRYQVPLASFLGQKTSARCSNDQRVARPLLHPERPDEFGGFCVAYLPVSKGRRSKRCQLRHLTSVCSPMCGVASVCVLPSALLFKSE